jgi:hypothetical protein
MMNNDTKAVDTQMVKKLVLEIVTTRADEMDCPECYEHLDYYADLILRGEDAAAVMPRLQDHLERCIHCREEFEALLVALRSLS